jgi:hypothetical protein
MPARHLRFATLLLLASPLYPTGLLLAQDKVKPVEFQLSYSPKLQAEPFSGRVFVVLSRQALKDGPARINWFKPEPFYAMEVRDWVPGSTMMFEPRFACPEPLSKLPAGKYFVQAIMDRDQGGQSPLSAAGNLYSKPVALEYDPVKCVPVKLDIDQTVPEAKATDRERVKFVDISSKLLSDFHKKPMRMRAGVVLPASFAKDVARRYPVVYEIPGFGGNHMMALGVEGRNATDVAGEEMLWVVLDANCRLGHHVFADSANNGPVGQALVEELIPYIEKTFRGIGAPRARFVTGHSSGGWSSLWLQVRYPDFFGGVWSTAPDSVDFRDFQLVNLYQDGVSVFTDEKAQQRPLGRKDGKVILHTKPFSDMEVVMGRGGQLFSFEAVFGPKGKDGQPRPLYDRRTGVVDPKTVDAWKKYDIRLVLEERWKELGPKLAGKLHVYMGEVDTFYLDGATRFLGQSLKKLGSDAVVEIFPGKDHGNLLTTELRQRIAREMAALYRKGS